MTKPSKRIAAALGGALLWGLAMALCLVLSLHGGTDSGGANRIWLTVLYFVGGVFAFPATHAIICRIGHRPWWVRLSASILLLGFLTIATTAALSWLTEWIFVDPWEGTLMSVEAPGHIFFSMLSAAYRFAVIGTRHYLPLGPFLVLAASLFLTRRPD